MPDQSLRFYVGVTDDEWFAFLTRIRPDEVNFWRPRAKTGFRAIAAGEPFLFKLHHPRNYIVGGGFLVRHSTLPLSFAWETFREKNGAPSYDLLARMIAKHRRGQVDFERDPLIGCTVLTSPFFLPERDWIKVPENFHLNLVRGKRYSTQEPIGARLWAEVQERLSRYDWPLTTITTNDELVADPTRRYGTPQIIQPRLGQGGFRVLVTEAYGRRCAITGERTLPVLQAAHIKPYEDAGPHRLNNGLLLRSDLHILLDRGLITLTNDLKVRVSHRIKEEYENGRDYYAFDTKPLAFRPNRVSDRPSREFLDWHNENVFRD